MGIYKATKAFTGEISVGHGQVVELDDSVAEPLVKSGLLTKEVARNGKVVFENLHSFCANEARLDVLKSLDTSETTNMDYMFLDCSSLGELDLSNFDTSKVTNMRDMFLNCSSLGELDLSNFDTSKVTDMRAMFLDCSSLGELDLSNFDTSKVTNMSYMFLECSSLGELDLSNFDTSKVTDMGDMFDGCISLTSLKIGSGWVKSFDISRVQL